MFSLLPVPILSASNTSMRGTDTHQLNLFYISSTNNITLCTLTCPVLSSACKTASNIALTLNATSPQLNPSSGLAAINVNNAQDWRIYYYDTSGFLNELSGNTGGFDTVGKPIGGSALNGSAIAAVNVNATTNNINVFYVDQLTQALFMTEFGGVWSVRTFPLVSFPSPLSLHPTQTRTQK